ARLAVARSLRSLTHQEDVSSLFARAGGDEMRHLRQSFRLKFLHGIFQLTIGVGNALVLAQMLKPGLDQKRLQKTPGDRRVLEHTPRIGAVASALAREPLEREQERLALRGIDAVLHRDQHRPRSDSIASAALGMGQCMEGPMS